VIYLKIFRRIGLSIRSLFSLVIEAIDFRDFVIFGGVGMIGYGLHLYIPWVSFTVCGSLLMFVGFFGIGKGD